ncbi:MAG: OstA-like protein, partial [Mucinivorans sp.]
MTRVSFLAILICVIALSVLAQSPPVSKATTTPKSSVKKATATLSDNDEKPQKAVVDYDADHINKVKGDSTIRMVGNVLFHHNGAIIQCDSAYRYDEQRMDCFGKVIINKDSAYIYGDKVSYDGNTNTAQVFAPIVKVLRGDVTLYTYNLTFDTKSSIGTYYGGGIMTQKDNFMESLRGQYNADSNIVKLLENVEMRSDSYKIETDSLRYNLDEDVAEFLSRAYIWDKDSNFLTAKRGFYFNKRKLYEFVDKAYILTKAQEMWGDTVTYYQPLRQAVMVRNVQLLDTANRSIALSDWGFYDDSLGRATLARNPSVRSYNEKKDDTTFMRADSILMFTFEAGQSKLNDSIVESVPEADKVPQVYAKDSTTKDSTKMHKPQQTDSLLVDGAVNHRTDSLPLADTLATDSTIQWQDSVASVLPIEKKVPPKKVKKPKKEKSVAATPKTKKKRAKGVLKKEQIVADSARLMAEDSLRTLDSLMVADSLLEDSVVNGPSRREKFTAADSTVTKADSTKLDSTATPPKERVLRAYHNVRMWSMQAQMVCDSTVGYSVDSMATLYGRPILWNEINQITSDQMDIYSAEEQIDWADCTGSPFITQQVKPLHLVAQDTARFNQAEGKRLEVYFTGNELDSAVLTGNVMNYYFMDNEGYTAAFATIECPSMIIYFEKRELREIVWEGQKKFAFYPLDQIPKDNTQRLKGFSWSPELRPLSAWEISPRS